MQNPMDAKSRGDMGARSLARLVFAKMAMQSPHLPSARLVAIAWYDRQLTRTPFGRKSAKLCRMLHSSHLLCAIVPMVILYRNAMP